MPKRQLIGFAVACAMMVAAGAAQASPARCYLEVNGHVYLNGICNFETYNGGSFSIGAGDEARSKYFAYVNIDSAGVARGSWNGEEAASHAHWELGTLVRQGACWVNDHAKVCARK